MVNNAMVNLMSEDNDDTDDAMQDTEDFTPALVDPVAAAIALSDLADKLYKLHKLATNSKANKAQLRILAKLGRQIADAEAKRVAIEADAAAIVTKAETEVKAIYAEVQRRLEAAATAEAELVEREQKIAQLENAWRNLGEPETVLRGFQSPQYSPLQKARLAHGLPPGKNVDPLFFSEPDAPAMRIDALSDTSDDPHADRQGAPFLGELTRDTAHKRPRANEGN
jgi:hypothetical protein